jgi:hypothetical protein
VKIATLAAHLAQEHCCAKLVGLPDARNVFGKSGYQGDAVGLVEDDDQPGTWIVICVAEPALAPRQDAAAASAMNLPVGAT